MAPVACLRGHVPLARLKWFQNLGFSGRASGEGVFASVVPAKAGTQFLGWIPAFAGMTFA
jgi:hypothetical protein